MAEITASGLKRLVVVSGRAHPQLAIDVAEAHLRDQDEYLCESAASAVSAFAISHAKAEHRLTKRLEQLLSETEDMPAIAQSYLATAKQQVAGILSKTDSSNKKP